MRLYALSLILFSFPVSAQELQHIDGYYRKDGNYVNPHLRTKPDDTEYNNREYLEERKPIYSVAKQRDWPQQPMETNNSEPPPAFGNPPGFDSGASRNNRPKPLISRY